MTTKAIIVAALAMLDASNDNHWTTDGQPRIDTVKMLGSIKELTREDITRAAPSFSRTSPLTEADKQAEAAAVTTPSAGTTDTESIAAPAGAASPATVDIQDTGDGNGQVHQETTSGDDGAIAAFLADDPAHTSVAEKLAAAQERLVEIQRHKVQILSAEAQATARVDELICELEESGEKETTASTIRKYLDGQNRMLEQRAAHNAKLRTLDFDVKALLPQVSPLDAAMRGRKRNV